MTKSISIIIPNWNGKKQLKKNLPLLFNVLARFKGKSEVIIIDDASTDKSREHLSNIALKRYSNIDKGRRSSKTLKGYKAKKLSFRVILNNRNLGFARSVNRGVKAAQYNVVFLLNTDVTVKDGCFDYLLPHFDDDKVFGVGANADWVLSVADFKDGFLDISRFNKIPRHCREAQEAFWICGGHSAFRRKIWLELGGLDKLFSPFYFEETDLCYRAWKRGYKILWEPKARVLHKHEESVIRKHFSQKYINFIAQRNCLFFIWKNIHNQKMMREHYYNLIKRIVKEISYIKVLLAALYKLPQIIKKRRIEKERGIISDKNIFAKFG